MLGWVRLQEFLVDFNIAVHHRRRLVLACGLVHDSSDVSIALGARADVELHGIVNRPTKTLSVVNLERESIAQVFLAANRHDGVAKSASRVHDGQATVAHPDQLRKPAGFIGGGHEHEVRGGIAKPREGLAEGADGDAALQSVEASDVLKVALIGAIGDEGDLKPKRPVVTDDPIKNFCEEVASFLNGIQPRGPKQQGCIVVDFQIEAFLEKSFVGELSARVASGVIFLGEMGVLRWEKSRGEGVDDPMGALRSDLAADGIHHGPRGKVFPPGKFVEKARANRIHLVGRKNSGAEHADGILLACSFVGSGIIHEIQVLPKFGGIDSAVLDVIKRYALVMKIVDGKKAWDAHVACSGWDQPGHPVVTMHQIRADAWHHVMNDVPLECQGGADICIFTPFIN